MKWFKVLRVLIAVVLLTFGAAQAFANHGYQFERDYYTDATYTEVCGGALVFCDGGTYWGCYDSPYYIEWPFGETCESHQPW